MKKRYLYSANVRAAVGGFLLFFNCVPNHCRADDLPHESSSWKPILWSCGLTGASLLVDRSLHSELTIRDHSTVDKIFGVGRFGRTGSFVEVMGEPYSALGVASLFWGVGRIGANDRAQRVGHAGCVATAVNGATTLAIKFLVGRKRPYNGRDVDEFRPFNTSTANTSFPSGHASTAFAMASVIATEYDDWRIDALSYGAAGVVAISRIYQDRHWLSDVVAGSALGIGIGKWAVRRERTRSGYVVFLTPRGIFWTKSF